MRNILLFLSMILISTSSFAEKYDHIQYDKGFASSLSKMSVDEFYISMNKQINVINTQFPKKIDLITTVNNLTLSHNEKSLNYNITLDIDSKSLNDINQIKSFFNNGYKKIRIEQICGRGFLRSWVEGGVIIRDIINDKNGCYLATVTINKLDCHKK
ncbi:MULTISPECIES: hypothetical protein [Photobacterium]|uniref:hypothetical protein n=1 Tax=Photobacterium TaxID=657 RepID=UPI001E64BA65|nr:MULTISPECIES: hypothetical protein [Photobacterium]MCD9465516.1 hypothetical protein [Photobacterium phosphoreum]MCD9531934.1 hypothetical protein [Photobacterium carnosum]MCD9547051.1 hypothetical protein [Photobacterium carnosum]